ncbi:MAG: hypothetical protein A3C44_00580 [Gammaproteobacteria bacterium RIFCSPHIGHO2_02_FULL_39_13]|nr:MAG: hypothetical protein A3C44_00580 [Gammaproteobacteria bacterium RIFCSPHIGHO2_02_FULL_39_13]
MKILKSIKKYFLKCLNKYFVFMIGIFITSSAFCDPAADPLAATVLPQIQALFGPTSTISYCIYLAEIIVGAVGYVKTKNLLILIGVPILVIFTSAMFTYIGGK